MFLAQGKKKQHLAVGAAIILSMYVAATAEAKKPGGGPHPPTPPGDVYISYYFGDYGPNAASTGVVMDADGNNAVFGLAGTPSYELHGDEGHRWFLQYGQNEIIAVRDDGARTEHLINDPSFGIVDHLIPPPWVPGTGDTQISFLGYDSVNDQQGVFTVPLVFDAIGTPSIAPGEAPTLAWSIPKVPHEPPLKPGPNPNATSHSWSADGTLLLYDSGVDPAASFLVSLNDGTESYLGAGIFPALSPDGTTVAYTIGGAGLATVSVDGTGQVELVEGGHGNNQIFNRLPIWSPDSEHIMFRRQKLNLKSWKFTDDIWRVDRDGGGAVNLTDWADDGVFPTAWRAENASIVSVPEPAGFTLLGLGVAVLFGCRRLRVDTVLPIKGDVTAKNSNCTVFVAAVLMGLLGIASAEAKKPDRGGGPPEPTPPGDVYINLGSDGYVMDADGNNSVLGVPGAPSYELHDGYQWFLQYRDVGAGRNEIIAIRDDAALTVQLTNDSTYGILGHYMDVPPPWVPGTGDTQISFLGYDSIKDQQGVFTVPVDFSSGTPVGGAPSLAWSISKVPREPPQEPGPEPNAQLHSWSADGTQLVHDSATEYASYLVDLAVGTPTFVAAGLSPQLSPDGTSVAFTREDQSLATVSVDGTGEVVLVEGGLRGGRHFFNRFPVWSPDGNHIVFNRHKGRTRWMIHEDAVWRVDLDGDRIVEVTGMGDGGAVPTAWFTDVGSTAIPEPGGVVMFGLGVWALLATWRRSDR